MTNFSLFLAIFPILLWVLPLYISLFFTLICLVLWLKLNPTRWSFRKMEEWKLYVGMSIIFSVTTLGISSLLLREKFHQNLEIAFFYGEPLFSFHLWAYILYVSIMQEFVGRVALIESVDKLTTNKKMRIYLPIIVLFFILSKFLPIYSGVIGLWSLVYYEKYRNFFVIFLMNFISHVFIVLGTKLLVWVPV